MHPNHITSLRLTNFKRFKDLEINDIGLVNLIVGDNNVGKTSILESLVLKDIDFDGLSRKDFNSYIKRYFTDLCYIVEYYKKFKSYKGEIMSLYINQQEKINLFSIEFRYTERPPLIFSIGKFDSDNWTILIDPYGKRSSKINEKYVHAAHDPEHIQDYQLSGSYSFLVPFFIPYFLGYNHDLTDYYSEHIQRDSELKQKFIESLQVILPDLSDILIDTASAHRPVLIIQRKGQKRNMPLATFGDGFTNLFRLMIEIYKNANGRIMLDEVDYGVHFDRKTGFWRAIIHAAQSNGVQIFATTHNNECITSLQEAGTDEDYDFGKDIRIIRLAEVKDKNVKAYTYNFDEFTHAIQNENELR